MCLENEVCPPEPWSFHVRFTTLCCGFQCASVTFQPSNAAQHNRITSIVALMLLLTVVEMLTRLLGVLQLAISVFSCLSNQAASLRASVN